MHRIDTSTAQKDKFGAGKNGFTLGNAQTGVPPTEVSADILDAMQEEICAVVEGGGLSLDKTNNSQLLAAIKRLASSRYFSAGSPLPTSNIGPIWHDDYADWMTWQTFNQNGANYTGYASRLVGSLLLDTQPTPRAGYIKSGVQNLSRTTYAALRAWAQHNGLMVAPGVWTAGAIQFADNADGTTFRIYDVRAEFIRAWDDNRGVDSGRAFGSSQLGSVITSDDDGENNISSIATSMEQMRTKFYDAPPQETVNSIGILYATLIQNITPGYASVQKPDAARFLGVSRPRNTALLAAIKF